MATSTPTLINLPPPPSDPVTPSDMGPGTPNSATTSLSALSTTAIKDGYQGQAHHHQSRHAHQSSSASISSTTTLDAERADRISRLAGLERVATARAGAGGGGGQPTSQGGPNVSFPTTANAAQHIAGGYGYGYFDSHPVLKERSTVGSASATGSVGGRTTWASGSDAFDYSVDKMSEDPTEPEHEQEQEHEHEHDPEDGDGDGVSSIGNISDVEGEGDGDARSLVGFGEGAGSTISGPISNHPALNRLSSGGGGGGGGRAQQHVLHGGNNNNNTYSYGPPSPSPAGSITPEPLTDTDARMVDGMTYDPDVVDTTVRTPRLATPYDRSPRSGGGGGGGAASAVDDSR